MWMFCSEKIDLLGHGFVMFSTVFSAALEMRMNFVLLVIMKSVFQFAHVSKIDI